jgi:hypothetical protein
VDELVQLENGAIFEVRNGDATRLMMLNVFLIASCCDKPAQSLVQCISEPTGAYGCGSCEIQGN